MLPENTLEAVESEIEISKERYIYPEEWMEIIDKLRLI